MAALRKEKEAEEQKAAFKEIENAFDVLKDENGDEVNVPEGELTNEPDPIIEGSDAAIKESEEEVATNEVSKTDEVKEAKKVANNNNPQQNKQNNYNNKKKHK